MNKNHQDFNSVIHEMGLFSLVLQSRALSKEEFHLCWVLRLGMLGWTPEQYSQGLLGWLNLSPVPLDNSTTSG